MLYIFKNYYDIFYVLSIQNIILNAKGMIKMEKYLDHTLLKPDANLKGVKKLCEEAKENGFMSVCINPSFVGYAKKFLEGSAVKVCTVIGFPLGASTTKVKVFEAKDALENGANEIDMVINIGMLKSKEIAYVREDIVSVLKVCKDKAILKVIIETCLLEEEEKKLLSNICKELKVDFVKTSTGFSKEGAKIQDIELIKSIVGDEVKIKASGGIRNYKDARKMIEAGANRLGTSKSLSIISKG